MSAEIVYFVYVLTFENGKIYVGMSKTDARGEYLNRFRQHASDARKGRKTPLYNAWRKHGTPTQKILSRHASRDECARAEIAAIADLGSVDREIGYNVALGGQGLHAPKGSAVHALMMEKVWRNPERIEKSSRALKGIRPSDACLKASADARKNNPEFSAKLKEIFNRPEHKARASELTKRQMTSAAREHLSVLLKGRPDPRSEEGKKRAHEALKTYLATEEGRSNCAKGYQAFAANPQNIVNNRKALDKWRASERNQAQCKEMAKKAAEKCSRQVLDLLTGVVYSSQSEMAKAIGVSGATITHWLKDKPERVKRVDK